jgi:Fe2+ transport system protein FeoA
MKLLSEISDGSAATVLEVQESSLKVKLLEMGFLKGKELKVLYRAPFGDPIAVDINGYVLSLRKNEASLISVEPKADLK